MLKRTKVRKWLLLGAFHDARVLLLAQQQHPGIVEGLAEHAALVVARQLAHVPELVAQAGIPQRLQKPVSLLGAEAARVGFFAEQQLHAGALVVAALVGRVNQAYCPFLGVIHGLANN